VLPSHETLSLVLHTLEERRQVFRMLLFAGEDCFEHAVRGWILVADVSDHLAIALDRYSLRNQLFLDHVPEGIAFDVFRMAARSQPFWRKVRLPAKLDNALRDEVGMRHFLSRMLKKFGCDRRGVNTRGHEIVALVAQHTDQLGRERFIQDFDYVLTVGSIA